MKFGNALFRMLIVLLIMTVLFSGVTQDVQAVNTCTWTGTSGTDWHEPGNWSNCVDISANPIEPGALDDVVIPNGLSNYPLLFTYDDTILVNSIVIQSGASITIDERIHIYANQFTNNGTIQVTDDAGNGLHIYSPFSNAGQVIIGSSEGFFTLHRDGTHTGTFQGKQLSFANSGVAYQNTFENSSIVSVTNISVGDNQTATFNGQLNVMGMLLLNGENALVRVSSTNLISLGNVRIIEGSLEMLNGAMSIESGSSLTGTATINGSLDNAGTVSPGLSPGTITVQGDYSQQETGTLEIELGGTTAGSQYDQLLVTGTAALDGSLSVGMIDGFTPAVGQSFTIMTYGSHSGEFSSVSLPALDGDITFQLQYLSDSVVLTVISTAGTINGTVTYSGTISTTHDIIVGIHENVNDPPAADIHIQNGESYSFQDVPEGTYYISAFLDVNDSGGGPPDPEEPFSWYADQDGLPQQIVISGGNTVNDVDILLEDPVKMTFLPLLLK